MSSLPSETDAGFLTKLGFTKTQAKIYLTLLKTGITNAKTLETLTKTPRPVVYRTLAELGQDGLVEKEIAQPYGFRATPIHIALQNLTMRRTEECRKLADETEAFLRKFPEGEEKPVQTSDYKLMMLDGKERVMHKIRTQIDRTRFSLDLLTALPRWLPTVEEYCENYEKALGRGVKFRIAAEALNSEISQRVTESLLPASGFRLKLISTSHNATIGIFDREVAIINFSPLKNVAESPIVWTNHPNFLAMCQNQFESAWRSTRKNKPERQIL